MNAKSFQILQTSCQRLRERNSGTLNTLALLACLARRIAVTVCWGTLIVGYVLIAEPVLALGQQRTALVIGNGQYATYPLPNPANDARLIANTLRGLNFDVIERYDANLEELKDLVRNFGARVKKAKGTGLFYYAGHAVQVRGENYLIPIGADIKAEDEVEHEAFDVKRVLTKLKYAGNHLNIVILDACRNNPFRGWFRSASRGLAGIAAPGGTLIAYATAPNDLASDNGGYARSLANHMQTPNLAIEGVFRRVARDVSKASGNQQILWYQSSITDEFNLVASSTKPADKQVAVGVYPQQPGNVFLDCADCPEMVVLPAGSFTMGSPTRNKSVTITLGSPRNESVTIGSPSRGEEWRQPRESPQHRVEIPRAFAVGKYEVSFDEWEACLADGGCDGYRPKDKGWGRGNRPVINVSWDDAQAYVDWLSQETGKVYRLLSEAEWEYAARARTETHFWWGERADHEYANYGKDECCGGLAEGRDEWNSTAPVGRFPANEFQLHDMHGNVWEWVEDCYNNHYNGAPTDGSAWTSADCSYRILRGGSWLNSSSVLSSAYRGGRLANLRLSHDGFRVARTLP